MPVHQDKPIICRVSMLPVADSDRLTWLGWAGTNHKNLHVRRLTGRSQRRRRRSTGGCSTTWTAPPARRRDRTDAGKRGRSAADFKPRFTKS